MNHTLITLCIIAHPLEYRGGRFPLGCNNHQAHLSIDRNEGLIHFDLATMVDVNQHLLIVQ